MALIKSNKTRIDKSDEVIYQFLADFTHFSNLMPEQVQDWQATTDSCSFTVSGIGQVALKIIEKLPFSRIVISPDSTSKIPFTFQLICNIEKISDNTSDTEFVVQHEMPMMISMMASRPLQNLVDIFGIKLKEYFEKN